MGVNVNSKLSERIAILATSLPTNTTTGGGTVTTGAVNIASTAGDFFGRLLLTGYCNSSNATTFTVIKGSDSSVTLATAIMTQTNASTVTPVVEFDLNCATQALNDTLNTYIAIKIVSTVNSAFNAGGVIFGSDGRYDPAFTYNAAGVNAVINSV